MEARAQSTPRTLETPQTPQQSRLPQQSYLDLQSDHRWQAVYFWLYQGNKSKACQSSKITSFKGNRTNDQRWLRSLAFLLSDTVRSNEFSEELLRSQGADLIALLPCRFLLWNLEY